VHREVRMTVNLRKSAQARMTNKKKGKFLSIRDWCLGQLATPQWEGAPSII
jgi:hypothetical protein